MEKTFGNSLHAGQSSLYLSSNIFPCVSFSYIYFLGLKNFYYENISKGSRIQDFPDVKNKEIGRRKRKKKEKVRQVIRVQKIRKRNSKICGSQILLLASRVILHLILSSILTVKEIISPNLQLLQSLSFIFHY